MKKYIIVLSAFFFLGTILADAAPAVGAEDGVYTLTVTSLNNGGTVASEESGHHLRGSLGLPVQGNIFGREEMIRSGFWFGRGKLTPAPSKSSILFLILPVLAGGSGS